MANDRLELLMKQSESQYAQGSPILLEACALYYDRPSNNCIAQIKWKNIDPRTIKAISIDLCLLDAFDQPLKTISHQYSKLNVSKGSFFGEKEAIAIDEQATTRYDVILNAVSFTDGSVYRSDSKIKFEILPEKKPVSVSKEFLDQYKRDLGKNGFALAACCQPQHENGLWQCGCGSWQYIDTPCLNCGATQEILEQIANPQQLKANLALYEIELAEEERILEEERIAQEKANEERRKAEEERRLAQEKIDKENAIKEAAQKKKKKTIAILIAALVVIGIGVACVFNFYVIPNGHYNKGKTLVSLQQWDEAVAEFEAAGSFNNSETQILATRYKEGEVKRANKDWNGAITAFQLAGSYQDAPDQILKTRYEEGNDKAANNDTEGAAQAYFLAGNYSDAIAKYQQMTYLTGVNYYNAGEVLLAKKQFNKIKSFDNSSEYIKRIDQKYAGRISFPGTGYFIMVKDDGTIESHGEAAYYMTGESAVAKAVPSWNNVIYVDEVNGLTVALTSDGYVLSAGSSPYIKSDVLNTWKNVQAIYPLTYHLAGITKDGNVVVAGNSRDNYGRILNAKKWDHIVEIFGDSYTAIGLKDDGTLVSVGSGNDELQKWTDIVKVVDDWYPYGLKKDGTVEVAGGSYHHVDEAEQWTDIVDIIAGDDYLIGLKNDGTVVKAGDGIDYNFSDWSDIVSICRLSGYVAGIRSDGSVVLYGNGYTFDSEEENAQRKDAITQWSDIVALYSNGFQFLGIKKDGSVISYRDDNKIIADLW